ncbi:OmpH family outer membrane protein [Candidatus Dependentiae bacterium]|nr:OmpH family outer membrane protein [Candidatus Dependentiae bacterium]
MKKLLLLISTVTLTQALEFRVIDLQKIFAESQEGREIEAEAMKKQQALAAELQKMQQDVMKKDASLKERASKGLVKEEEVLKKRREIESDQRKFELRAQEIEQELREYQNELQARRLEPFRRNLRETVEKYGAKNKCDVIMTRTGEVVYVRPDLDVTEDLLKALNSDYAAKAKVPTAKVPSIEPKHPAVAAR